ncbi:insulinase family protein [Polynucleobacter sp. MWH-Spelu-300-X4]|uniref:M16 family metallopeptidase n=1 Tax=Polynucleobacter sp. MWH-Spelu-300-X4 TaxID=2689109 RepID=UPI001BFE4221|nr:pitrilysin family protein [Polynucleobacter sp. MWH-Spelu-300-X4]QWD79652.1 insulinase family protein [Polynucleobacter sp. MWH-Spelu-300-X4]
MSFRNMKYLLFLCATFMSVQVFAEITIKNWTHSSGAKVFLVETASIPMVDLQIDWGAGAVDVPVDKTGLASLTAAMLDKGAMVHGKVLSEAEISDRLADQGAVVSVMAGADRTSFKLRSLSDRKYLSPVIDLAASVLSAPVFDAKILNREKDLMISSIKEANLKPEVVLGKEFDRQLYGSHPLSRSATVQTVEKINISDVRDFYKKRFFAANSKITIVGNLNHVDADAIIDKLMKGLPVSSSQLKVVEPVKLLSAKPLADRVIKINHPSQQAHISMGLPMIARKDPDYFPLLLGNYILGGGGFVSRLMKEVREKRGLAYSVYSYVAPGKDIGPFVAGMQTKKEQSDLAVKVMTETITNFVTNGPTDEEIKSAKENLTNGFPLRIDSNKKILDNVASIAWNELPLDTLNTWTMQLNAVTKDQVIAAYKKHLDMNKIVTVVVGGQ